MSYSQRSSIHNLKAKLAADYNDLLKELSSHDITSVGCYTIGETIGQGSFGKVKLGVHKLTGQQVAIKKINKQHASLIAREIHHHRQLDHPNIVRIYEIIATESAIHIFSEYCPNGELFDLLTSTGRFEEHQAQRWFFQLTDAIQTCHRQGIVHRDLKLENILLDANDNCKICDFGFARFADQKQLLETFCGSLAYSAPEVIMRQKYTGPETDIWSLGVILYTLLAGELPFDDDSEVVMQRKIVNIDYHMPTYFSLEVRDLLSAIFQHEPSKRLTLTQIMQHPWMQLNLAMPALTAPQEDELDDFDDNMSASTRNSSRSDLDSIFSHRYHDDDDDLVTEASSHDSMVLDSAFLAGNSLHRRSTPSSSTSTTSSTNSNMMESAARFSPQVRFSLGMLRAEDKARFNNRSSPRYSAPSSAHHRLSGNTLAASSYRSSLPLMASSSSRPSSLSSLDGSILSNQAANTAMNPTEQRLASALVAAGFDQYIVQSMRTNVCGTTNTLWNMLLEKQQMPPVASPLLAPKLAVAATSKLPAIDVGCQTSPPSPLPVKQLPSKINTQPLHLYSPADKSSPRSITSFSSSASSSSASSATTPTTGPADRPNGWLSSVKSWFNSTPPKERPLASYRDFDVQRPIDEQDPWLMAEPVHRSGSLKYRRHLMPFPTADVDEITTSKPTSAASPKQLQSSMTAMLTPTTPSQPSPPSSRSSLVDNLALLAPGKLTRSASLNNAAMPSLATSRGTDVSEKRYSVYRPLPPPPSSYTNDSRKSNNRQCYQHPCPSLPIATRTQPQQQPSPPPSPPNVSPTLASTINLSSSSPKPSSPASPMVSPASSRSSSPTPSFDTKAIPPTLPASPPTTNSLPLTHKPVLMEPLKPNRPSPIMAPPKTSNMNRRFEFAPRSRLSVYGMNERPMASKAIIEEEEEEEE
ncbi:Pkinase-domain-containing protein [Hesseltinella vesiculosa]|uniref:Pkinase-domain-containing protein n=1 Tax=Hesseltinella vesiculosa TaxID=101127 RepID=A0A1X2GWP3_9FUNG|nr:Pkinase-domain-containing protein [Hesseltinella vesiculosa]